MIPLLPRLLRHFRDRRRMIFRFHDGVRTRYADPLKAYRDLKSHPAFDWDSDPQLATLELSDPSNRDFACHEKTVAAVRDVFSLPSFEAGGLTETECGELLAGFIDYLLFQKKSSSPTPTSPEPTASPSLADESPTPNDSGST